MVYITDDPLADFDRYEREQEKAVARLPVCAECDEPISDDTCYEINGEIICPECLNDNHKHWVEDFMD